MERARGMETLRQDDIERARLTPPEEKAKQAFALMRFGIKVQRARLRQEFPDETEEQIRQRLLRWMARDE
jgi:1,2-phenylacetyl-CoA epoxidase catalytic subunit